MANDSILIIDDDLHFSRYLEKTLAKWRLQTHVASDAEQSLELFCRQRPSVVMADIFIPGGNGFDLLEKFEKVDKNFIPILMTGHPGTNFILRALRLGAADFLTKPVDEEQLKKTLNRIFSDRFGDKRTPINLKLKKTEIDQLKSELMHSRKMSALGELSADLAHEINQPLACLKLTCQDALETINKTSDRNQDFHGTLIEMLDHIEMISNIVENMRHFSHKGDEENVKVVNINDLIQNILTLTNHQLTRQGIVINLTLSPQVMPIKCQPVLLQQVMMNILSNAKDALISTKKIKKEITIKTEIKIKNTKNDYIAIVISDTADGIPDHLKEKIFQPLFTTKDSSKGTGLGLSICQEIIKKIGGTISFHTEWGVGTTFIIGVPINRLLSCDFKKAA